MNVDEQGRLSAYCDECGDIMVELGYNIQVQSHDNPEWVDEYICEDCHDELTNGAEEWDDEDDWLDDPFETFD